jgi:hypothetical protein
MIRLEGAGISPVFGAPCPNPSVPLEKQPEFQLTRANVALCGEILN